MTWKPDPTIENLLSPGTTASLDQWRAVKDYLLRSFAAFLGQEIDTVWEPLYEDISPGWGFAFGIRSQAALGGPLQVEWYGVISHNGHHTAAFVLLFAHNERAIHHKNHEYLEFEFQPREDHRQWVSRGWSSSEVHEWDGYLNLSKICDQAAERNANRTNGND